MPDSVPYRCEECMKPGACGYHGVLVFEDQRPPKCRHNEKPGEPCHEQPVDMRPARPSHASR